MTRNQPSGIVSIDALAKDFGVESVDDFDERVSQSSAGDVYGYAYREAIRSGMSEDEAEEAARVAEDAERDEAVGKYMDAIASVAGQLYGEHGLLLQPRGSARHPFEYNVVPERSWEDAADRIRQTINGVGMFEFSSLREFLDSGPWTARQAVLGHLHWIADYPRVYGGGTARSLVDRQLR